MGALLALALLGLGSCATLGIANPFSSGMESYEKGMHAWRDGNQAKALYDMAWAIRRDNKHYPAINFMINNYSSAMATIEARLAALKDTSDLAKLAELAEIYSNLTEFHTMIHREGQAYVLESGKKSLSIEHRDFSAPRAAVIKRGNEMALVESKQQLAAGNLNKAKAALDLNIRHFYGTTSDERNAARTLASDLLTEEAEKRIQNLTAADMELIKNLIMTARSYAKSDRLDELNKNLETQALAVTFKAADELAAPGTIAGYEAAIAKGQEATNFVTDRNLLSERLYGYVNKLVVLLNADVETKKTAYNNTEASFDAVGAAYLKLLRYLTGWEKAVGFDTKTLLAAWAKFNESSKVRVFAVANATAGNANRDALLAGLKAFNPSGKYYWFHSAAEFKNVEDAERAILNRGDKFSNYYRNAGQPLFADTTSAFTSGLRALNSNSPLGSARDLGIDVLISISATLDEVRNLKRVTRKETVVKTYYVADGVIKDDPATITLLKLAKDVDAQKGTNTYQKALTDAKISLILDNQQVTYTYQTTSVDRPVTFKLAVQNTASGQELGSSSYFGYKSVISREVCIDVATENATIRRLLADKADVVSADAAPMPPNLTFNDINDIFKAQVSVNEIAGFVTRY
jgi:hypothetical protein